MKHTILIIPLKGTNGSRLICDRIKYKDGHEYACLRSLRAVRRDQMKPGDEPINQNITRTGSTPTFSFNFEDSGGDSANKDRMFMADVIRYHTMMYTEGFKNPRSGAVVLFEFEDLAMNDKRNYKMEAMTLAAKNKAWAMSYRSKLNAYYFYGENPQITTEDGIGIMDHTQLTIRLCGDNVGLVMRRSPFGATDKTYLQHFVEDYKPEDENYVLRTSILKALVLRDGEGRPLLKKEGSAIIFGEDLIGSTIDEAAVWLNNNPKRKDFLLNMVKQSDTVGADNVDEAILVPEDEKVEKVMEEKQTEDEIRKEAKAMMIPIYWNKKLVDLAPEMEKARPIWQEVKNMGLQAKIDAMEKPNLEKVIRLVENEKKELLAAV